MEKLGRLSPEDRDNLTAYLDGELDENATRRIESILTSSAVARNEVEALARTYDLLDSLPRPKAPDDFTQRTVATAKLDTYRKPFTQQKWFRPAQRAAVLAAWLAALTTVSAIGYAITNRWIPQPEDEIVRQLPVLQNLDTYNEVKDAEFLQRLSAEPQLLEELRVGVQPFDRTRNGEQP